MRPKVYFRADGNAKMGLGHVIRSLALADMLKEDFKCHFIIRNPLPTLREQILTICESIITLPETDNDLEEVKKLTDTYFSPSDIVVLDGYNFVTDYQKIIKGNGCKLVCIDDIHAYHFVADTVINHAGGITQANYSAEQYTEFYLGLRYALLRQPFLSNTQIEENKKNNLFICLGGADPHNDTLEVLKKCEEVQRIDKCYVILGAAYQHQTVLEEYLVNSSLKVELRSNLNANEMVNCMQKCGQAITTPSTVSYEYLSIGGTLYLKVIADNQISIYNYFTENGIAFDYQKIGQLTPAQEQESWERQAQFFDGNQKKRFLTLFKTLKLSIRRARIEDVLLYFDWINDPDTRSQSYNSASVSLENHQQWFQEKVKNETTALYVILQEQTPIGQIRFDIANTATISFSLDKKYRGQGLGVCILKKGVSQFRSDYGNELEVVGFVKKSNIASAKAFRLLDFKELEAIEYENSYKYILA